MIDRMPPSRLASLLGIAVIVSGYACASGDDTTDDPFTGVDAGIGDSGAAPDGTASEGGNPAGDAGSIVARSVVAMGGSFGCVLTRDRLVFCWGRNDVGQLGSDPASTPSCGGFPCNPQPTRVEGLTSIVHVVAGDDFACALDASRTVWCWGANAKGQLATSGVGSLFTPRKVILGVASLDAAAAHACAITTDNRVYCWGENTCQIFGGAVGPVQTIAEALPNVPAMTQISIGTDAMCGTKEDGRVLCWGADHQGSLGHDLEASPPSCNGFPSDPIPKSVMGTNGLPIAEIADVHIGAGVACARHKDGKIVCWGDNQRGALGQGVADGSPHRRATEVPALFAEQLDLHGHTPCAIVADRLFCWGDSQHGQLESLSPNATCGGQACRPLGYAINGMSPVRQVTTGPGSIATIKDDLSVWVWGRNSSAELAVARTDGSNVACPGGVCIPQPRRIANLPPLD
jgi:alpha-tubulin suppressor-like RCC1 family protein